MLNSSKSKEENLHSTNRYSNSVFFTVFWINFSTLSNYNCLKLALIKFEDCKLYIV